MPLDLQPSAPGAFLCAVLARGDDGVATAVEGLAARFGAVRARSATFAFDMSDYYAGEMGPGLSKCLVWLGEPLDPAELAQRKAQTIDFERRAAVADDAGALRRTVNVDPGVLSADSLVLATTKANGHRIAIAPGLYAEVTLRFERGQYRPQPWTYPDYRQPAVQAFLLGLRGRVRALRGPGAAQAPGPTGGAP